MIESSSLAKSKKQILILVSNDIISRSWGMHVVYFDQCLGVAHSVFSCVFFTLRIKLSTSVLLKTWKIHFFVKFKSKFFTFLNFFSFLVQKMLKMHFSTSGCSAQHPNTGQNLQQMHKHFTSSVQLYLGFKTSKPLLPPLNFFLETKRDKFAIAKSNDKYLRSKAVKLLSWTK